MQSLSILDSPPVNISFGKPAGNGPRTKEHIMRKSSILLIAVVAAVVLGPASAGAREQRASQPARATHTLSVSPRTAAAHAESRGDVAGATSSRGNFGSGGSCGPNGKMMLDDGLMHTCR
jgi:hypothetical protein